MKSRRDLQSIFLTEEDEDRGLFRELAIDPPLAEFRRVYDKKARSFEMDQNLEKLEPYRRAYELGERLIRRHLGDDDVEDLRENGENGEHGEPYGDDEGTAG